MSISLDVANKESIEDCIAAIKNRYQGPPTICVNNAAILNVSGLLEHTDELIDKIITVNLKVSIPDYIILYSGTDAMNIMLQDNLKVV